MIIKKTIILIVIWLIYVLCDYFILPYYIQPIAWIFVCLILGYQMIRNLIKVIKLRKNQPFNRIVHLSTTIILFFLTFYNFDKIPCSIIEKADWTISFSKREDIVNDVKSGKLKPNTAWDNGICSLPFSFPIVSNGGNEIWILENNNDKTKTVKFWISRGFFDSPQTYFIYTNDSESKKYYENMISESPDFNWKLEENWYRIMERY